MAEFPASPVSPSEFFESFLPKAFQEDAPPESRQVDVKLGVRLDGEGGGEWLFEIQKGAFSVTRGSRDGAAFTVVQSVDDWRGALWEGRGGAIGRQASAMFRPGEQPQAAGPGGLGGPPNAAALKQLEVLNGVIRMVVTGGDGGDWQVDFKLGPGAIPESPTTTLTLSDADASAMERGELNPMEAFMSGRIQLAGDMTLMMQMQAIQMQAAAQAAAASSSSASSGGSGTGS